MGNTLISRRGEARVSVIPTVRSTSFLTKEWWEGNTAVRRRAEARIFITPTDRGTSFRCLDIVGCKGVVLIGRVVHKTLAVVRRHWYFRCQGFLKKTVQNTKV